MRNIAIKVPPAHTYVLAVIGASRQLICGVLSILALTSVIACESIEKEYPDPESQEVFAQFAKARKACGGPGLAEASFYAAHAWFRENSSTPWEPEPLWKFDAAYYLPFHLQERVSTERVVCFSKAGDQIATALLASRQFKSGNHREALNILEADAASRSIAPDDRYLRCRDVSKPIAYHCPYGVSSSWKLLGELRFKVNSDREGAIAAFEIAEKLGYIGARRLQYHLSDHTGGAK